VKAALAGSGFIARVHAIALRSLGVEVAAVCSRTFEGAQAFGEGRAYATVGELLDAEEIDVLHVCSPNNAHAEQGLAAIERGVHVVCEKPLAVSTAESAAMLAAAEQRGVVHATCYHVRGYPLVEQMRAEVESGATGETSFVHGRYLCDDVLFPASGWRVDPARSGPSYVVGDLGTHWLDLAEHVTGQHVTEVLADFRQFAGGPLEDYAALLLRFSGGASGSLVLSAGAAGRKNQLLFELEGTRAGLTWDQEQPTELVVRPADGPKQIVVKDPNTNAPSARAMSRYPAGHGEGYGEAFRNLFENVYAAIEGKEHAPFPTFVDGHRGVATLEAAVASGRGQNWVPVSEMSQRQKYGS
jgi:predicted dehydrogenase